MSNISSHALNNTEVEIPAKNTSRTAASKSLHGLDLYVFSPQEYFRLIANSQKWLGMFLLCSALALVVGGLMSPFLKQAMLVSLPAGTPPEQYDRIVSSMQTGQWFSLIASPIIVLLKCAMAAVLLHMICLVVSEKSTFKSSFVLIVHLLPITILQSAVVLLALSVIGVASITKASDVQTPIGLDMFLTNASPFWNLVAHEVNLFNIVLLVYLAIGVQSFTRCSRKAAIISASFYLAATTGLTIAFGVLAQQLNPQ
jgi:hypothetical protein